MLALAVFWRPIAAFIFGSSSVLAMAITVPNWASEVAINVLANLFATGIVALVAIGLLKRMQRHALAGKFKAYDVVNGAEQEWGTVELRYALLAARPTMRLRLTNGPVLLEGEGLVNKEQHFVGHYRETSDIARRRYGAFMMVLDGNNTEYAGQYLFVDPSSPTVQVGLAKWKRVL